VDPANVEQLASITKMVDSGFLGHGRERVNMIGVRLEMYITRVIGLYDFLDQAGQ
jgi:hypothetical protein